MFFISSLVSILLMPPSLKIGFFIIEFDLFGFASIFGFSFPYPVLVKTGNSIK